MAKVKYTAGTTVFWVDPAGETSDWFMVHCINNAEEDNPVYDLYDGLPLVEEGVGITQALQSELRTRDELIDELVHDDIETIKIGVENDDYYYLSLVLRSGTGYEKQTNKQLSDEYLSRSWEGESDEQD
jgi:hypothetical protein